MNQKKRITGLVIGLAAALLVPVCVWMDDEKRETIVQSALYKLKVCKDHENGRRMSLSLTIPGLLSKENREEVRAKIRETMEAADVDPEEMLLDLPQEPEQAAPASDGE